MKTKEEKNFDRETRVKIKFNFHKIYRYSFDKEYGTKVSFYRTKFCASSIKMGNAACRSLNFKGKHVARGEPV